jgi:ABC-2 type transport system permease protein
LEEQVRDTIEFTNFLVSSDGAYSKTDMTSSTVSKEKGDIDGPFNLGIAVEESYDDAETKLAVFGSAYLLDDSMISTNQFGNADLLLDTINWMVEHEAGLNIATKSIEQQYVTVQPAQIGFWGVLLVIVLPVLILVAGIVVWMRRRKA